ncbi:MAG: polysaccharide biosynthesis/export family protein [Verrucomicrobiales bacterium]|jgi:polysaccharide export outer membrane protein|nr:polysaccharide biosynthesis/export family protein [Verrucomicrobiales bacterium]
MTRYSFLTISALMVGAFLFIGCSGPKADVNSTDVSASSQYGNPDDPEYNLIRKGDALTIQLSGVPVEDQATYPVKVDDNGNVSMPMIGNVKAAGVTVADLKNTIETLYKSNRIYTNPNITIYTQQERYVSVNGEVKTPQQIIYYRGITALTALAQAGGFTDYANRRKCKLLRGDKVIEFNAQEIQNDPKKDIPLLPNDRIQVDRSIF